MGSALPQQPKRLKGLRIATRCATLEEFVATFERLCDRESVFISTNGTRPVGLETAFSIELTNGTPALRGLGVVRQSWTTSDNPFGRPGVKIGIHRLTADSVKVFQQLLDAKERAALEAAAAPAEPADNANTDISVPPFIPPPPRAESRTPGSELVLPANPLSGITDKSLAGFVDCTIFEETGNFFPVEPDPEAPGEDAASGPPDLVPIVRRDPTPRPQAPSKLVVEPERGARELETPRGNPVLPLRAPAATPMPPPSMVNMAPPPVLPWSRSIEVPVPVSDPAIALSGSDIIPPPVPPPVPPPLPVVSDSGLPPVIAPARAQRMNWKAALTQHRRWVIASGVALLAVIVLVTVLAASGSGNSAPREAAVVPREKPAAVKPAQTPEGSDTDGPEEPGATENGMPVVGKGPCKMAVTSTPAGAAVQVDGQAVGPSPIVIAGPCKARELVISHARYAPATKSVKLTEGKTEPVDIMLQRPMHHLLVETQPNGAIISIAGRRAGSTPSNVDIMGFTSMEVTVSKPGYKPVSKRVYSRVPNDRLSVTLSH